MTSDRRDSYRFGIEEGRVRLYVSPSHSEARVLDLSASGGCLITPASLIQNLDDVSVVLHAGEYPAFDARVVPVYAIEECGFARVGVRFDQLDRKALRSLSRFLIDRFREESEKAPRLTADAESIGSPRRDLVRRLLLYHTVSHERTIRIYRGQLQLPLQLRAKGFTAESAR